MARQRLDTLFCQRFDCQPSEFEAKAFSKCLYWHARLLAPLIRILLPNFFESDLKFIRYLGAATGIRKADADALDFQDANSGNPRFFRTGLKLRVSGRKASRLAHELFAATREPAIKSN